jgi:DNA-binding response OmpR family regulator
MSTVEECSDRSQPLLLVVDDDPEILRMLTMRLKMSGYQIVTACDGQEAIDKVRSEKPDLVVLDVMMPRMNGWEVARALRQEKATRLVKIIMLTAIGPHVNEMTSPLYGADDHIDKPFEFRELEARIERLLHA